MSVKKVNPIQKVVPPKKVIVQNNTPFAYRKILEFFSILVLVFITYGNSIKNDYNIDDGFVVSIDEGNKLTNKGIWAIPKMLTSNYSTGPGVTYGYRPLGKITMAIEYSLWENNPQYSHFINLLLFALNVYLLLLFIKKIAAMFHYENMSLIYLSLVLFILHPIHTEVVCSIKNREEILCFIFTLSAALVYFKFREKNKWIYLLPFILLTVLAFLSKQTAVSLLGIILLIIFFSEWVLKDNHFDIKIIKAVFNIRNFIVLVLVYYIFRFIVNDMLLILPPGDIGVQFESNPYFFSPDSHSFPNGIQTIFFYLKKLIIPFPLLFYYGYNMLPDQNWNTFYPYAGILLFIIFGYLVFRNIKRKQHLFFTFWLLFFAATLFPFTNLFKNYYVTGIVGERLIYQASAGFCMLLIYTINYMLKLAENKIRENNFVKFEYLTYMITGLIALPYFILTIDRNKDWKDKKTLYENDIQYLSNAARANYIYAGNIMKRLSDGENFQVNKEAEIQKAIHYFNAALKIYPKVNSSWLALGNVYRSYLSMPDSALFFYSKVDTSSKYTYVRARELMGSIYYAKNDSLKALQYYKEAFTLYPQDLPVYKDMVVILLGLKKYDEILPLADIAIKNKWPEGYANKGDAYLNKKDTALAVEYYEKALENGFKNDVLLKNLDYYYKIKGINQK
jgi:tetratricopeptide (TPR) repeat protein